MNTISKLLIVGAVVIIGLMATVNALNQQAPKANLGTAIVYKTLTCGCCSLYAQYLEKEGFTVKVENLDNLSSIKEQFNIPSNMGSCHTTVIGDYFVEGHIPVEAITKMLTEKPAIKGIAMPGMPSGSPGMPGPKEPFNIFQLSIDGNWTDYLTM